MLRNWKMEVFLSNITKIAYYGGPENEENSRGKK